jgi:predicted transcriptional regulator
LKYIDGECRRWLGKRGRLPISTNLKSTEMKTITMKTEGDPMTENVEQGSLIEPTADIVSAYVSNNSIQSSDLPTLISEIHAALHQTLGGPAEPEPEPQKPAVSIKKSVTPDYIICLDDGKKFKSLKRHVRTFHDVSPEEYREKWGLPADYPMVAPNYAKARSMLAKKMGLGRKPTPSTKKKSAKRKPAKSAN